MSVKLVFSVLVLVSLLTSCNMPTGQIPATQPSGLERVSDDINVIGTAVELTAAARFTEIAGSVTATFTPNPALLSTAPCSPLVTTTVNANVRSGPGTAYDIVGYLPLGQSAAIIGRNDAYTWWYINYPSSGSYAWIAGSVVTSSCVPAVVQIVAAPPLPTVVVADNSSSGNSDSPTESDSDTSPMPDLDVSSMTITPNPATQHHPISVQITIINHGDAPSGHFSVQWWASWALVACNWSVSSLAPSETKVLHCPYTYQGWNNGYAIKAVVDSGNLVDESNEGNNSRTATLKVRDD